MIADDDQESVVVVAIPGKTMSLPAAVPQETREIRPCRKFDRHTGQVSGVIHLPGGQRIMTCPCDDSLRAWDLQNGKQIRDDWRDGESDVNIVSGWDTSTRTPWTHLLAIPRQP
jgi:WD40 repeat protein